MPVSLIPSFLSFCFINGITPGPANLCSLSTAMNEGKQAALRQWRGLFTGFAIISLGSVLINAFLTIFSLLMALSLVYCAITLVR